VSLYGVYFMHPLFAVTGAAIGLTVNERAELNQKDQAFSSI
jgi:hypothetical protein